MGEAMKELVDAVSSITAGLETVLQQVRLPRSPEG